MEILVIFLIFFFSFGPILAISIGILVFFKKKKRKEQLTIKKVKENNHNVDIEKLKKLVETSVLKISESIIKCDYSKLMSLESKTLYEKDSSLIKQFMANDKINYQNIEKVSNVTFLDYKKDKDFEHIFCRIRIRCRDISIIPSKNKLVSISDMPLTTWKFIDIMKSVGVDVDNVELNKCPNCGAEVEINNLGQCIYCKSYLINGTTSWVVNRIEENYFINGNEK